jgi:lipid A disaccharide synthetase
MIFITFYIRVVNTKIQIKVNKGGNNKITEQSNKGKVKTHKYINRQNQSTKTVLLMPGSRESEVKRLLPELLAAVVIIKKQDSQLNFHIALANVQTLSQWMTNKYRSLSVLLIKIHLKWKQTQHQISGFFNFLNPVFAPRPHRW